MIEAKTIEDYTYLWYDVRPHPNFGTVEIRAMDCADARRAHARAGGARPGDGQGAGEHFEAGQRLSRYPFEMLDENRWIAARHGLDGEMVDLPGSERVPPGRSPRGSIDRMRSTPRTSDPPADLEAVEDLLERGNGAHRQVVVYEANHDLHEVMREIVDATAV